MVTKYAYTLSSRRSLAQEAIQSIKSLSNWVDPSQIVVFYTPPWDETHRQTLLDLGVDLRETENETPAFAMSDMTHKGHYGEKIRLCDIDADTVVFLDCDTIVLDDPEKVISGDFDFKARPGTFDVDEDVWRGLFERYGREYMDWMPNAGFMVFKNRTHQEIKPDWRRYINEEIELSPHVCHGEQYALALAVGGYRTEKMAQSGHAFRWQNEAPSDGVVYHGYYPAWKTSGGSLRYHMTMAAKGLIRRVSQRVG